MLEAYRRHTRRCPHRDKGAGYSLCKCPLWCDGNLGGRRYRRSLQTNDVGRAQARIEQLARGESGTPAARGCPALGQAVKDFIADAVARNLRASTVEHYGRTLAQLTASIGATIPVHNILAQALDRFRRERQVKPSTQRRELETVRAFFAWCEDHDWLTRNPAAKLKPPKVDGVATLPYSPEEVAALLAACDELSTDNPSELEYIRQRARAILLLLLYSGIRISDASALKRSALDANGFLTLRTEKTGVPLKVRLHPDAVAALRKLPSTNPAYFFWSGRGSLRTLQGNMRRTMQRLGAIANVHAHPHRARDTFACELLLTGADIRTVQKLLGHTSVRTTERHYAHFVASHQALLDAATARLNFGGKPSGLVSVYTKKKRLGNA